MSDFPIPRLPPNITIWPFSLESVGVDIMRMVASVLVGYTWPTANLALFVPFVLLEEVTVKKLWWYNGNAQSGNVDAGVYDSGGNLLSPAAAVAQAGSSVLQVADITDFVLGPGLFYLALVLDNTTGKNFQCTLPTGGAAALGMFQMAAAYPLPAVATFASCTTDRVPMVGLTTRVLV
jgi:hypothetical protein